MCTPYYVSHSCAVEPKAVPRQRAEDVEVVQPQVKKHKTNLDDEEADYEPEYHHEEDEQHYQEHQEPPDEDEEPPRKKAQHKDEAC